MAKQKKRSTKRKKPDKITGSRTFWGPKQIVVGVALIAGVSFLFLWPVIFAEFTELDDKTIILENTERYLRKPEAIWRASIFTPHYKPLVLLSWLIEAKLFGLDARVLHFNNLLLHTINSILVFFITLRLARYFDTTKDRPHIVALVTALLFAAHPIHIESIAWAIERKDVLYTCFFLLGILCYLRYTEKQKHAWMWLASLLFGMSLMSKSPAIMFPAVVLLIDWAAGRPLTSGRLTEKWPIALLFIGGLIVFGVFGGGADTVGGQEGSIARMISEKPVSNVYPLIGFPAFYAKIALIGLKGVFWYLHTWFPAGLSLAYPYRTWLPAIGQFIHIFPLILGAGFFLLWKYRNSRRFLVFTHLLFFLALTPALIRTGLGKSIFLSDRYVYLASVGLVFFAAGILMYWMQSRRWPLLRQYLIAGILVAICGVLAFRQARVWKTGETLWTNVIEKFPLIDYAYVNRGIWYHDRGMNDLALADFTKAIELDQFDTHALIHRGGLLRRMGNPQAALADLEAAVARDPKNQHAINSNANALFDLGRFAEAEALYTRGIELAPRMLMLLVNRAASRINLNRYDEALEDLARAEQLSPNYANIYHQRTVIYLNRGDYENAILPARRTAELDPQNHAILADLGTALQRLGRHREAVDAFTEAIRRNDRVARYYRARAVSYEALSNITAAREDRARASEL